MCVLRLTLGGVHAVCGLWFGLLQTHQYAHLWSTWLSHGAAIRWITDGLTVRCAR
jgi:hypothetical protein